MRVTVVTVVRDGAATIADTLRSVAAQDHADLEHLVVDGASTDDTEAVFRRVASPRASWSSSPDAGLYDAMNKGVRAATGELIGFLNADDFFCRTDAVSRLVAAARVHPAAAAISGAVAIVAASDATRLHRAYAARAFAPWMLRFGHMPPHPGFYARRGIFDRIGGFDPTIRTGADFEWMLRFFAIHGLVAATIPETLVTLRAGGLSNRGFASRKRINAEALASLKRHRLRSAAPVVWSKYALKALQLATRPHQWPAPAAVRWPPLGALMDAEAGLCQGAPLPQGP